MDGGHGGVPVGGVGGKVGPEVGGGELGGHDHGTAREERGQEAAEEAVDVEEGHDEHGAVGRGELVGLLDIPHGPGQVAVGEGHDLGAGGGAAGVEDEGGVLGLGLQDGLLGLALELAELLHVEGDFFLGVIPVGLGDGGIEPLRGLDGGALALVGALGDQNDGRLDVLDVELELVLFVGGVQGGGDATLPRGGQERDDELVRVDGCDGDGRPLGDADGGELLLERGHLGDEVPVGDGQGMRPGGHNDGHGVGCALDG